MTTTGTLLERPATAAREPEAGFARALRSPELLAEVRELSRVSNLRGAWVIARQWIVIAASVAGALWIDHWGAWALAGVVIFTRQHALGVLVHDGTHHRLFTNRRLNDGLCDIFCAFPVALSTELYRRQHLKHHDHLNTDADPYWYTMTRDNDWDWPKAARETLRLFVLDLLGAHAHHLYRWMAPWTPYANFFKPADSALHLSRGEKLRFAAFLLALGAGLTLCGGWLVYLLLWVVPSLTLLVAAVRLRSSAEHLALANEHELNASRHVDGTWLERLAIAPLNINCHIDHHLFPSVPYFNLPRLHRRLMREPLYHAHAHVTPTYLGLRDGVLAELVRADR